MIRDYKKIEECQKSVENTYEVAKNIYGFLMSAKDKMDEDTYKTLTHDVMIIMDDDDLACPGTGGGWGHFTTDMHKVFRIMDEMRETCSEEFINEKLAEELFRYLGGDESLRALEWITRMWEIKITEDLSDFATE